MTKDREVTPQVALRLRYIQLERLGKSNQTCCDVCKEILGRDQALETWCGDTNLFVSCLSCLQQSNLLFRNTPGGLEIVCVDKEETLLVRPAKTVLPSRNRPKGF